MLSWLKDHKQCSCFSLSIRYGLISLFCIGRYITKRFATKRDGVPTKRHIRDYEDGNGNDDGNARECDHEPHADVAPAGRRCGTGSIKRVSKANWN